jgi:hypothetical protein
MAQIVDKFTILILRLQLCGACMATLTSIDAVV